MSQSVMDRGISRAFGVEGNGPPFVVPLKDPAPGRSGKGLRRDAAGAKMHAPLRFQPVGTLLFKGPRCQTLRVSLKMSAPRDTRGKVGSSPITLIGFS